MSFDAIVVGGGLAGSTFAGALAERGHAVLVLEKDRQFRDRVRGENMLPWGVAVARRLGIVDDLRSPAALVERLHTGGTHRHAQFAGDNSRQ